MPFIDERRAVVLRVVKWGKVSTTEGKVARQDGFLADQSV